MENSDTHRPMRLANSDWRREPAKDRMKLRDDFFRGSIDARRLLEPFDQIPGILYFVKDAQCRLMAISPESAKRIGLNSEEELIGRTVDEYLPEDLSTKYLADDLWVLRNGKPLRNIVEMWFNAQGVRDWVVTDKYPLRNSRNEVVGVMGIIQSFDARRKMLAHLGPVGKAADFIRDHLGDPMMVPDIARQTGFSERQLQRLFRRAFGMTIQQFIIQSRIHAAIHELTHSERSIAEIASLFGFSDQSAFTNKFHETTGTTPRAYREKHLTKFTT